MLLQEQGSSLGTEIGRGGPMKTTSVLARAFSNFTKAYNYLNE